MKTDFDRRTSKAYSNHKARAKAVGQRLDYELQEFRAKVREALNTQRCAYCRQPICETTWSADHSTPISRRGSFSTWNIAICCEKCNRGKGCLTSEEWVRLLECISEMHPNAQTDVWRRLLLGAKAVYGRKKKQNDV